MYTLRSDTETYSFIAVDACLEPGPRRPFNFIGSLTEDQFELLESFEIESRKTNGTIWFGESIEDLRLLLCVYLLRYCTVLLSDCAFR